MQLHARGGSPGLFEVHAPLPPSFRLEEGTNLLVARGGGEARALAALRAHARGRHDLPPVRVEAIDPTGLGAPRETDAAPGTVVEVAPRAYPIRRLRARAKLPAAHAIADVDEARLGVDSTDFRELREYAWGDAPNAINWRATARRLSALGRAGGRHAAPVVNEYEKEGRRTVFVLLDGGEALRVGTSLETGLDHGVEAALAASRFFLARGSRVGAWSYGCRAGPVAPPEAGSGHAPSLERALSPGEIEPDATLPLALRSLHQHLAGAKPLLVVVTRVTPASAGELAEAARRLRVLLAERRRGLPMIVVDVQALRLAPAPSAAWATARDVAAAEDRRAARSVQHAGARVVPWRPGEDDLRKALHRGGIA